MLLHGLEGPGPVFVGREAMSPFAFPTRLALDRQKLFEALGALPPGAGDQQSDVEGVLGAVTMAGLGPLGLDLRVRGREGLVEMGRLLHRSDHPRVPIEGGYVVPEDGFLEGLRALCDRYGILLVADEIQSGAGRTGTFWAIEQWGVRPDILLTAKGIASGLPLGAMVARRDLMERWGKGAHGSTYGGNPLACAAALATIRLLDGGLIANARVRGGQALAGLADLPERYPGLVAEVRGRGLMIGIEFTTADAAEAVQWACFERGLLVLEAGDSAVRLSPPLTVTEGEMATALELFRAAVAAVAERGAVEAAGSRR
ncbi:MAG: aminotransferase class III-fold pyridoxal phosphate-dependent enzyme [Chloroflexi bacterium]|nr:aminotransferase class III-fold pyridoxal phosphate-dependent enzyme [Chloroflexota bacterium]